VHGYLVSVHGRGPAGSGGCGVKPDIAVLRDVVVSAAREELLPRFNRVAHTRKADGSLLTEADLAMQERVSNALLRQWPGTVFLGEEMPASAQQQLIVAEQPVWCLDPLDGTSNFAVGIPYFCVSLALFSAGRVQLGLVYDPLRDECFSAVTGQGAMLNGEPLRLEAERRPLRHTTAMIDFKRLQPALATRLVQQPPYASQRSFGSVALDWCWLSCARSHVYLHGRSRVWDYAAGHLIFEQAGGLACTLEGEPVFTQSLTSRSAVGAIDRELFAEWTAWLGIDIQNRV
jgi:myo-inositol-1(or 4)-monophosphatase